MRSRRVEANPDHQESTVMILPVQVQALGNPEGRAAPLVSYLLPYHTLHHLHYLHHLRRAST
jgi:hypothetical protein